MTSERKVVVSRESLQQIKDVIVTYAGKAEHRRTSLDDRKAEMAIETIESLLDGPDAENDPPQVSQLKDSLAEWLNKTEWIQKAAKPHEIGRHRADVLTQRAKAAELCARCKGPHHG